MYKRLNLWTIEQEQKLIQLLDIHPPLSRSQIAARMKKTKNSIIGKIDRLRNKGVLNHISITKKQMIDATWRREDIVFLKNYLAKGFAPSNIAKMMHRSKESVVAKIAQIISQ